MKKILFTICLVLLTAATGLGASQPAVIFSQEVFAITPDGHKLPAVSIEPQAMPGMQQLDYPLGHNRILRVATNITDPDQRGLNDLVATIRRCYSYIETSTGRQLERGLLLYLVELDQVPSTYSFRAEYEDSSLWGEVRLVLIERGDALSGPNIQADLAGFLYDTLPHELGHDVLRELPQLAHDIDGHVSQQTRWFIEGVCEVLAKGFSRQEAPVQYRHYLTLRKIDTVLSDARMQKELLHWSQQNANELDRESDLYGAALLAMTAWLETVPLNELLDALESSMRRVRGHELVQLLGATTGLTAQQLIERAHTLGAHMKRTTVALLD